MSSKKKLSPHETWDGLEKQSLADEAARVAKLSDAELNAELAAHGVDPKAIRAKGAALAESLGPPRDETLEASAWVTAPRSTARGPSRRRSVLLLAAALAVFAIAGGAVALGIWNKPKPPPKEWPDAAPSVTEPPAPVPAPVPQEGHEKPAKSKDKPRFGP
jgi:hypothetical protein